MSAQAYRRCLWVLRFKIFWIVNSDSINEDFFELSLDIAQQILEIMFKVT